MAAKQSRTAGSRKENAEHWIPELMISVVLRKMGGLVSIGNRSEELMLMVLVGRANEVTIGHRQVKPTSQCTSAKIMVLNSTKLTFLKETT